MTAAELSRTLPGIAMAELIDEPAGANGRGAVDGAIRYMAQGCRRKAAPMDGRGDQFDLSGLVRMRPGNGVGAISRP